MKKTALEPWGTFEKLCLVSVVYKLKNTMGDQNWAAISKQTKILYDTIGGLIEYEKKSDEWFSVKQCCAQFQALIKGTGARKKKRGERSDSTENLELLEASLKQEFQDELQALLDQMRKDYKRSKQIVDDIDNNRLDDERVEELLAEIEDRSANIKTKLKTMLDEKIAETENTRPSPSQPGPSVSTEVPSTSESKPCSTTSPLLTSLLQSPSPLIRTSLPSASSPTISLLLNSSPPVPITDSTLSKLLESSTNIQTTPTTSTVLTIPSTSSSQQSPLSFKPANEEKTALIGKDNEKIEEGRIILEEITEHDVVESEVIIEQNESPTVKKSIPRRLDLEVEDIETEEEVLETVEEMIERVEEAIIETDGENNVTEIHLSQAEGPAITIESDITELEIGQEQTVEVIVLGSTQEIDDGSNLLNNETLIISGPPVKINQDTVIINEGDESPVKISDAVVITEQPVKISDAVVIAEPPVKISESTIVVTEESLKLEENSMLNSLLRSELNKETRILAEAPVDIKNGNVVLTEPGTVVSSETVILTESEVKEAVILAEAPVEIGEETVVIAGDSIQTNDSPLILAEESVNVKDNTDLSEKSPVKITDDNFIIGDSPTKASDSIVNISKSPTIVVEDSAIVMQEESPTASTGINIIKRTPERSVEQGLAPDDDSPKYLRTTIIIDDEDSPVKSVDSPITIGSSSSPELISDETIQEQRNTSDQSPVATERYDTVVVMDSNEKQDDNEDGNNTITEKTTEPSQPHIFENQSEKNNATEKEDVSNQLSVTETFTETIVIEDSPEKGNSDLQSDNCGQSVIDENIIIIDEDSAELDMSERQRNDTSQLSETIETIIIDDSPDKENREMVSLTGGCNNSTPSSPVSNEERPPVESITVIDDSPADVAAGNHSDAESLHTDDTQSTVKGISDRFSHKHGITPTTETNINVVEESSDSRTEDSVSNKVSTDKLVNKEEPNKCEPRPSVSVVSSDTVDESHHSSSTQQAKDKEITNVNNEDFQSKDHSIEVSNKTLCHSSNESNKQKKIADDDDDDDDDFHSVSSDPPLPENEECFKTAKEGKENVEDSGGTTKEYNEITSQTKIPVVVIKDLSKNYAKAPEHFRTEPEGSRKEPVSEDQSENSFKDFESITAKDSPSQKDDDDNDDDDDDDDDDKDSLSDSDDDTNSKDKSDSTTTTTATPGVDELDDKETLSSEITDSEDTSTDYLPSVSLPKLKLTEINFSTVVARCYEEVRSKAAQLVVSPRKKVVTSKKQTEKPPRQGRKRPLSSIDSKPDSPSVSISSSDEDRDLRAWKKSIMLVYNRLASHKFASVFSRPITDNEAPGYHEVILRPMDLSTIKRSIENGTVRTTVEFQRDMLMMVQNAIIYNKNDTPYYKMALEMGKDMLAEMEIMVQALGDGVPLLGDIGLPRARTSKSSLEESSRKRKTTSSDEGRSSKRKRTSSS